MKQRQVVADESPAMRLWGRSAIAQGKESFSLFWSVVWKVMAIATLILGCLFVWCLYQVSGVSGDRLRMLGGLIVVFGQGLFYSGVLSLAVGTFAVAFRWFGVWIFVPTIVASLGSGVTLAIAFEILKGIDFPAGGRHGGGEIIVLLLLGYFTIAAIIGAVGGSTGFVGLAMLMKLIWRRHRGARPVAGPLPSTTDEKAGVASNSLVNSVGTTTLK